MTSLLPPSTHRGRSGPDPTPGSRPLALVAALGGASAAGAVLTACLALGVVGWFLSDAGAHGTPSDGMRAGALVWLAAHGSGVQVDGVAVTAVPLGLSLLGAWAVWRLGLRVGEAVWGHGPDADRIGDGERDWTVPAAAGLFAVGYVVVVILTASIAATPAAAPDTARATGWALVLCAVVGAPAVAVGSGRAAVWTAGLPSAVRTAAATTRLVLLGWLAVAGTALLLALALDLGTALNIMSQLDTGAGGTVLLTLAGVLAVPNAVVFSGSYLLGPGFTVGVGTLVSPAAVVVGPLPMFPLLAALPDTGTPPAWLGGVLVLAPLTAGVAAVRARRGRQTLRWDEGALQGGAGGIAAGIVVGLVAALAQGSVGPGRMRLVGPLAGEVLVHAIVAFGIGGLLGGLASVWWARRQADPVEVDPVVVTPVGSSGSGPGSGPGDGDSGDSGGSPGTPIGRLAGVVVRRALGVARGVTRRLPLPRRR